MKAFEVVLQAAVAATPVLVLALGACHVMRRSSAAARHSVLTASLFATALLFVLPHLAPTATIAVPIFDLPAHSATPLPIAVGAGSTSELGPELRNATPIEPTGFDRTRLAATAWAIGCALLFLDSWLGWLALRRRARAGQRASEQNVHFAEVPGPVTFGVFPPVILMPWESAAWPTSQRAAAIAHERAHVARRDWATQVLANALRAVLWFHPLMWAVAARHRREAEEACDAQVLVDGTRPSEYASLLLQRAAQPAARAGVAMATPTHLARRIHLVLAGRVSGADREGPLTRRLACALILALALPASALDIVWGSPDAGSTSALAIAQARWSGGGHDAALFLVGPANLAGDDSDVVALAPGGRFLLVSRDTSGGHLRQLHVGARADGRTWRTFAIDGRGSPFDDQAQQWLAALVAQARNRLRGDRTRELLVGGRVGYEGPDAASLMGSTQTGPTALTRDGGSVVAGRMPWEGTGSLAFFKGGSIDLAGDQPTARSSDAWLVAAGTAPSTGGADVVWTTLASDRGSSVTSTWCDGRAQRANADSQLSANGAHAAAVARLRGVDWLRTP